VPEGVARRSAGDSVAATVAGQIHSSKSESRPVLAGGVQAALCGKHGQGRWFESTIRPPQLPAVSGSTVKLLEIADIEAVEADQNDVNLIVGRDRYHAPHVAQRMSSSCESVHECRFDQWSQGQRQFD
jgi:hypothetical protein